MKTYLVRYMAAAGFADIQSIALRASSAKHAIDQANALLGADKIAILDTWVMCYAEDEARSETVGEMARRISQEA
jgi:hypothetical protein